MASQIVEVTQKGYSLRKRYGFLEVSDKNLSVGKVPLDDIAAVVISVPGCMISSVLIDHLCQRNIPLVIAGENFMPASVTLPLAGYGKQHRVMKAQSLMTKPRQKRVWQNIVRTKIFNQSTVLRQTGADYKQLEKLSRNVKSGDPDNYEAQAARIYWRKLFGKDFRRDRALSGLNSAINYTYTIVRACVARGVSGAGLHPSFSLRHINPQNPFNLVDDLIEPFRPVADYFIWTLIQTDFNELTVAHKKTLASIINLSVPLVSGRSTMENSPISLATIKVCRSFANYCNPNEGEMIMPGVPTAIEIDSISRNA